jgi:hypothetical protein
MTWIVIWGATAIIAGALAFFLAGLKNRDSSAWAAWCFLLPPLLIALLLSRRNPGPRPRQAKLDELDKEVV